MFFILFILKIICALEATTAKRTLRQRLATYSLWSKFTCHIFLNYFWIWKIIIWPHSQLYPPATLLFDAPWTVWVAAGQWYPNPHGRTIGGMWRTPGNLASVCTEFWVHDLSAFLGLNDAALLCPPFYGKIQSPSLT